MNFPNNDINTKPIISIEGKMSTKDAGKVVVIMAYGKSISLVIASLGGLIAAITALICNIFS